jgi:spore coat polysaccharide biosynthesis predicted glycosyltransferase SpsG
VRRRAAALGSELVVDAPDLVAQLAQVDLAIGAGGVGLLERMAAGVPSIGLAIADNQRANLEGAAARGAVRFLGPAREVSAERLAAEIAALADDAGSRAAMTRAGRALVDGRGADRVAAALLDRARRAA